jgi:glycine betaine/proline transport system substrate-binding protein
MLRVSSPRSLLLIGAMIFALVLASCSGDSNEDSTATDATGSTEGAAALDEPITFADLDWVSPVVHNRVAQFILEEGYGYETDAVYGTTQPLFQGMVQGDIQVTMEIWPEQLPPFEPAIEDGDIVDLGENFPGAVQGWWVPTYMIEGDAERGIEPITPDLRSIDDLPQYAEIFQDPEDPSQGRIYNGIPGWELTEINEAKIQAYGLDEHYNSFLPGSSAALMTSLTSAYDQGEPWLGFLWQPHWIFAEVEMTKLEEPEYTEECWEQVYDGEVACAYPEVDVHVSANADFAEQAPEVIEFLENYETTKEQTNAAMFYMEENGVDADAAALWFLEEYEDQWTGWVSADVAETVKDALSTAQGS